MASMSAATSPPPVPVVHHELRCTCDRCCSSRAAEVRRRIEDARREEGRGRELAYLEALGGVVYARLGSPKPQPGTLRALAKLGRVSR